jgi:hypothetical protein
METDLNNMSRAELLRLRAEIDWRLGDRQSTIAGRRDHRDGWLQNEYRRNKSGMRGPYWYFYRIVGGARERVYIGKTDDPEGELERQGY